MMNSSTGFKKRNLHRPPSSILSNNRQYLKIVDISQSQPIINTTIRTQCAAIQQQINILDQDKRIRTGQSSLEKGYILNLKKWLRDTQTMIQKQQDDIKILKYMGTDTYQTGFKKLWKIITNIDLILSKITQLQIIQLIKYDQMFQDLAQDSLNGQRVLQAIAKAGFNPSTLYPSQLALQRQIQLYSVVASLKKNNPMNSSGINTHRGLLKTKDDSSQLIQQLRNQNKKLTDMLDQIQHQDHFKKINVQSSVHSSKSNDNPKGQNYSNCKNIFNQLELKYKEQLNQRDNKISKIYQQLAQLKINYTQLEVRLKAAENDTKNAYNFDVKQSSSLSYEQALLQQMDKMKKGFQKKIQKILQQFSIKQKQLRKKQYQYKTENDKIKWEKNLLLKKFDAISH